jgi:hypothetical protein
LLADGFRRIHLRMKIKLQAVARETECPVIAPGPQAWRAAAESVSITVGPSNAQTSIKTPLHKLAPLLQLAAVREERKYRITLPAIARHPLCLIDRETLATLRAAELAVWQASGGDFLHRPNLRNSTTDQT